ncbi:MAG: non-canonical purine NTP pyrophosphatase [bacterium]|nr:non-canonical purine NTP pyrophosphatase [bacterium]MDZ4345346.1 non-canonical purine NTP pyrophosphatase [Candidatus Binatia bacterium]
MRIAFVTTNKHKFREVTDILKSYPVELEHLDMEYEENHDDSMDDLAAGAAKKLAAELNQPIVLEDTGLFFTAYPGFPGALPKFVFNTLGYEGIFKLLAGTTRQAYFKTVAGFCQPNQTPQLFTGIMRGTITEEVFDADKDAMPYDRIFIHQGKTKTNSAMTLVEKNAFSQRAQAFRQFGEYIKIHDRPD